MSASLGCPLSVFNKNSSLKVEQGSTLKLNYFPDDPQGLTNQGCPEWIRHDYAELHKVLTLGKAVA